VAAGGDAVYVEAARATAEPHNPTASHDFGSKEATVSVSEPFIAPLAETLTESTFVRTRGSCRECGYALRGLLGDQPCPECGTLERDEAAYQPAAHAAWARCVFAGLVLSLLITMQAVCSVLVQPFRETGGAAPAMNVAAPKLWAMPLLQRPIGRTPELPGVIGTRVAMLSLLAIWLITAPRAADSRDGLRRWTRWTSVTLFGLAFGVMMASQGVWPEGLAPYRIALVAAVELPAAILLYAYLRRLADHVPGEARRVVFDRLVWLVPAVMGAGAIMLAEQWIGRDEMRWTFPPAYYVLGNAAYGVIAITAGVAASGAVMSLAGAYFCAGFPFAPRWFGVLRYGMRRASALSHRLAPERIAAARTLSGSVLLLAVMALGLDQVMWSTTRTGIGANLPFVNFPGPKVWASAGVVPRNGRYTWEPLVSRATLIALNLAAVWLLAGGSNARLYRVARWLPVLSVGVALGLTAANRYGNLADDTTGVYRSRIFAVVTVLGDVPATVMLYALLARLAQNLDRPKLANQFRLLAAVVAALIVATLGWFLRARFPRTAQFAPAPLGFAAAYGAISLCAAAWATAAVCSLAGVAARRVMTTPESEPPRGEAGRVFALADSQEAELTPVPAAGRRRA
jgi:hypothetical protein